LKGSKVDTFRGVASFVDSNTVQVGDQILHGKNILIATGGRPTLPQIPGVELGITSDGFFDLEQQPKKVAVVGAGYIAVELAGIFNALGSKVRIFQPLPSLLELVICVVLVN